MSTVTTMRSLLDWLERYEPLVGADLIHAYWEHGSEGTWGFDLGQVKRLVALFEGENDGPNWRWLLELNDGRYASLLGGCDYTGWDCQSAVQVTLHECLSHALQAFDPLGYAFDSHRAPGDDGYSQQAYIALCQQVLKGLRWGRKTEARRQFEREVRALRQE